MSANYLHGIETLEIERGPRAIRVVKSAVIALIGTAPAGPVKTLTLSLNDIDGAQFGTHLPGFSIPEALDGIYDFGAGTVLVYNVLDPSVHKSNLVSQPGRFADNDLLQLTHGALQALAVKSEDGSATYDLGTDYSVDMLSGRVRRLSTGSIPVNGSVKSDYTYADPSKVTPADVIGAVSLAGQRSGLLAFQDSYTQFGFFPKIFIAPGFSTLNAVSVELIAAAIKMGGVTYIDAPIGTTVQQVIAGRGPSGTLNFNTSSDRVRLCYPHVKVYDQVNGDRLQPLSIRAAGLRAKVDNDNGYWWSSSNKELLGVIGLERPLTARIDDASSEVNLLNENGITTVFNSFGTGLRLWGNRTAAWPTVTHMRNFENVRRTKDIIDESIRYSSLQFVDMPVTDSLIDSIVESVNLFMRKLIGDQALIGAECWYDPARNPQTEVEQGHLLFNYKLTVPLPFERGTFETEITGEYLVNLGAA
ncbi:phage tail sheath subtilisin-like domain-containing protein [Pseudomonas rubra]|uniref:Phage tail sheath subtilisin-like domain-containing protein n=1 Tax=Pseudomonas rubra TaxID=2942627 RepID=A0ABT5PF71_9PSED|nr:phage tail sheath subtilisin-like domain-containing protein [Pseudomonas rubra]MDD1016836.1 phage tail sheath subtilisin-like domain-containing protein [Pseudomonas rubra]MDD1041475.1 phage tail sheath subtilisin-like domain-containing protein [Pseudomonas rubra]MDD1154980.1 phage tail sheath subtilisin-like domain-containing protein [Pseudomonas rubra]